ncbi:MAG: hypothetical protein FIA99_09725 [Ruminiclostridium sp.]|nr:hypothetical protein [Ruminiclostridium sp.]
MREKTAMEQADRVKKTCDRFRNSLRSSVEYFRKGEDHSGLDSFLNSMADFESLLEHYRYSGSLKEKIEKIVPSIRILYEYMKNQDITGMTDILEFKLYPLTEEWAEGCDEE